LIKQTILRKLRTCIRESEVDALLFFNAPWAVGGYWQIFGTNAAEAGLVTNSGKMVVVTWSVLDHVVRKDSWADEIVGYFPYQTSTGDHKNVESLFQVLKRVLVENVSLGAKIGIEEGSVPSSQVVGLKNSLPDFTFKGISAELNMAMAPKALDELKFIKKAIRIADKGAEAGVRAARPGITELELAGRIAEALSSAGSYQVWFPIVALSGPNSQFLGKYPTSRKIKKGDLVLMDLGPVFKGYYADISRTVSVGKPSPAKRNMLEATLDALDSAIDAIKPGVKALEVDRVAREVFKKHGLDGHFVHHLGHPVFGPWGPMLIPGSETILQEGMTFTLEPGVYLPRKGGVRIEDNVIVTNRGATKLDKSERRLWPDR
jgi:Xaa-Pro dipeptidase